MDITGIFDSIKGGAGGYYEITHRKKCVVAALKTGYGKTLIFMILPKILDKVPDLILPLTQHIQARTRHSNFWGKNPFFYRNFPLLLRYLITD